MGLFDKEDMDKINAVAKKSKQIKQPEVQMRSKRMTTELDDMSKTVIDYFKDSEAILISDRQSLHEYVDFCIDSGYCGIDTETTGLDRSYDTLVGASLYTPGHPECYIPSKHIVPLFETPYKNQLSYDEIGEEFQRLVDNKVKLIFANADFDIAMIYKDLHVDMIDSCYFDVLIAARCLKEDEPKGDLKSLYNKYVLKGTADPKKFSDFFSPTLFPYCNPDVAKLYAANDAKITYELFRWQLPYLTKTNRKCMKRNLQAIADLVWNVEFPLIKVCALIHRTGMYIDSKTANSLHVKYTARMDKAKQELADMVQDIINEYGIPSGKKAAFRSGTEFNCESPVQVKYLLYDIMKLHNDGSSGTGKEVLKEINLPVTNKILEVRSLGVLIDTFVDKLPNAVTSDSRIHGSIRQIGAATGRMSSADPNLQNIPSHASDIRHMFRGTSSKYDVLDCKIEDNNHISFTLSKYDSVYRYYDDSFVLEEVKNLEIGDHVRINYDKSEEDIFDIKDIILIELSYNVKLIFEVSNVNINYRLSFKTSSYVMLSCDYSKQEPAITALVSDDKNMQQAFIDGKDIYSMIASIAFNKPYEDCLEFHPVTHEYQKDGKARRGEAKTIVLGICYGRSVTTIGEQLYGNDDSLSSEEKTKKAQHVYDEVLKDFPNLKKLMDSSQHQAATKGYVETILGRRRHIPDMMLKPFEFKALPGYVNPDIDPLDPSTFTDNDGIPDRIVKQLEAEFLHYKYYGQIVNRTKELRDENIQVINNRGKIQDASRRCVNSIVQGSAADMTKMAMLSLQNDEDWNNIGGRLLVPVHDELICEVPKEEWKRGGEILSKNMLGAADFMPFPMSCDVDVTLRWSGLEYPCPYKKPISLDTEDEDEIKWVQYHLCEMEYDLPVFNDKNGDAPRGDAVHGVNGIKSSEYFDAISDYEKTYSISEDDFINHIENNVEDGIVI